MYKITNYYICMFVFVSKLLGVFKLIILCQNSPKYVANETYYNL